MVIQDCVKDDCKLFEHCRPDLNCAPPCANSVMDAIVAHVNEFCNICDLSEVQLITMRNFSSWVQQQHQ